MRDDLVRLGVAPAEKFSVIRLGIELDERIDALDDAARGDAAPARRLAGRVRRRLDRPHDGVKRTDDVLLAFQRLVDRGVDACLLLVGDGPDREHLEQCAHELGITQRCLFLGYQRTSAVLRAFDALLLPSANEGTPVSVIEALAARPSRRRDPCRRRAGRRPRRRRRIPRRGRRRRGRSPIASPSSPPIPSVAPGWAQTDARASSSRYAVQRLVDDIDRLYRSLLAADAHDG